MPAEIGWFWYFVIMTAISATISYFTYQHNKSRMKEMLDGMGKFTGSGYLANTRSSEEALPVLYGRHRIGGNQVYISSTGANNELLHMIMTLSEGPIEGIETIYLDDKPLSDYGGNAAYEFFNGAGDQPLCQTLRDYDSNWYDHMRYTSYLYVRLSYDYEVFTGIPKVTAIVKGRLLYDPRSGNTGYSDNPALVWYDFMTSKRYGLGIDASFIDIQSVMDAANWCDAGSTGTAQGGGTNYITLSSGSSTINNYYKGKTIKLTGGTGSGQAKPITAYDGETKRATVASNWTTQPDGTTTYEMNKYTFNGIIADRQAFLDNLSAIASNFRADTIWSEGKYRLLIRTYSVPVMSFNEDEIVEDSFSFAIPGFSDTPNRLIVKYADEAGTDPDDLGWVVKDYTIEDSAAVLQYDLEERDTTLPLNGTTNAVQAGLLAVYNLERMRLNKVFSFSAHPRALALDPGDTIQVTHTLPGWDNRLVRVMDINAAQGGLVALTVVEEDVALYDDILNLSPHSYFQTTLPNPLATVPEVTGVSFTEEEYFNKDVSYTRLKVTFNASPSPFWDYSEAWVNVAGVGYNHYTDARGSFTIEPVKEAVNYKVKLLSVSIQGVRQDIGAVTEHSYDVIGKNTLPATPTNFKATPQSDSVVLSWDPVNIVDLQGYEIRRGTNWDSGIFTSFTSAINLYLGGIVPGTHSYMIKSVDTNGKYSFDSALISTTVYGLPNYVEKMSELNIFSSPSTWLASITYASGDKVIPVTANGYYYKCTTAGTSGGTQPTWPILNGSTVNDGTVTWTCYEEQIFTNTERYYDSANGWELRVIHDSDEFNISQYFKAVGTGNWGDSPWGMFGWGSAGGADDGIKLAGWSALNTNGADVIDSNMTKKGWLTIDCNANSTFFSEGTFSGPFIYKTVRGNFDIETYAGNSNYNEYAERAWLIARDTFASAGEDFVGISIGYGAANQVLTRNNVNSVNADATAAVNHQYLRLTRVGNVFTAYSKALSTDTWTQRGQYTRNDFAYSIHVGLGATSDNTTGTFIAQFDYFKKLNGNLSGIYMSPVYDRGSSLVRRSWLGHDALFEGTGAAWNDQFGASDLWTTKFGSSDTWLDLFGAFATGTLKLEFGISSNGTTWTWFSKWESFVVEAQGRYVKYKVSIDDVDVAGYLHLKAPTYKESYI